MGLHGLGRKFIDTRTLFWVRSLHDNIHTQIFTPLAASRYYALLFYLTQLRYTFFQRRKYIINPTDRLNEVYESFTTTSSDTSMLWLNEQQLHPLHAGHQDQTQHLLPPSDHPGQS